MNIDWRKFLQGRWQRLRTHVWMGSLRRTSPISDSWGFDRGLPIDRYYIENFLLEHKDFICGHVLEIKNSTYTERFGSCITRQDVLDIDAGNPCATIVVDLAAADILPSNIFDCFILTQTLQFILDPVSCIRHAHRILKPGGVLLLTVPSVSRIDSDTGPEAEYWRFTVGSCRKIVGDVFGEQQTTVQSFGNVLTAIAFLVGMARQELTTAELDKVDPNFPVLIGVRAIKK